MEDKEPPSPSAPNLGPEDEEKVRTWASMCHFAALMGVVWWIPALDYWFPFGHILCPFLVWAFKRSDAPAIDRAGRESLRFQLHMTLYGVILGFGLPGMAAVLALWAVAATNVYLVVRAGIDASLGKDVVYPLAPFHFF